MKKKQVISLMLSAVMISSSVTPYELSAGGIQTTEPIFDSPEIRGGGYSPELIQEGDAFSSGDSDTETENTFTEDITEEIALEGDILDDSPAFTSGTEADEPAAAAGTARMTAGEAVAAGAAEGTVVPRVEVSDAQELSSAIENATGKTEIVLMQDISFDEGKFARISSGKDIIINLNQKTLTGTTDRPTIYNDGGNSIVKNGKIVVGKYVDDWSYGAYNYSGTMEVRDVTFDAISGYSGSCIANIGELLNVYNCTTRTSVDALSCYSGTIHIYGGNYENEFGSTCKKENGARIIAHKGKFTASNMDSFMETFDVADDGRLLNLSSYYEVKDSSEVDDIAEIDGKRYADVSVMLKVWKENGGTLKLLQDISYSYVNFISQVNNAVLDLNGHQITLNGSAGTGNYIKVTGGDLTIKDTSEQAGGKIIRLEDCKISNEILEVSNGATLKIESGVFEQQKSATFPGKSRIISGSGNIIITGGTFKWPKGQELIAAAKKPTVTITGGEYNHDEENEVSQFLLDGYVTSNKNGIYEIVRQNEAAEVNGTRYNDLQSAVNNANGSTVKLLRGIKTANITGNGTIDLAGFSIENMNTAGNITLKNTGVDNAKIKILSNTGTLTLNSGKIGTWDNNGSAVVKGGTVDKLNNNSDSMGDISSGISELTILGGVVTELNNGSAESSSEIPKLLVKNGNVNRLIVNSGTATINDGSIPVLQVNRGSANIAGGTYDNIYALNTGKITINGGTFKNKPLESENITIKEGFSLIGDQISGYTLQVNPGSISPDSEGNYAISDAAEWIALANIVAAGNSLSGKTVTILKDLDFAGKGFRPLGEETAFSGIIDGNNKTISNISYKNFGNNGLIATSSGAKVRDLTVDNCSFSGNWVGVLAGEGAGLNVENCVIRNCTVADGEYTGGVIGHTFTGASLTNVTVNNTLIKNCFKKSGGLVGYHNGLLTISECTLENICTAEKIVIFGQAVGHADGPEDITNLKTSGIEFGMKSLIGTMYSADKAIQIKGENTHITAAAICTDLEKDGVIEIHAGTYLDGILEYGLSVEKYLPEGLVQNEETGVVSGNAAVVAKTASKEFYLLKAAMKAGKEIEVVADAKLPEEVYGTYTLTGEEVGEDQEPHVIKAAYKGTTIKEGSLLILKNLKFNSQSIKVNGVVAVDTIADTNGKYIEGQLYGSLPNVLELIADGYGLQEIGGGYRITPAIQFEQEIIQKKYTDDVFQVRPKVVGDGIVTYQIAEGADTSVADVDSTTGNVTIKGAGETTIIAKITEGTTAKASWAAYTLNVAKATPTLSFNISELSVKFSSSAADNPLSITGVREGDKTEGFVKYSVDNEEVAAVDPVTGALTRKSSGTVTVTAKIEGNPNYSDTSASYIFTIIKDDEKKIISSASGYNGVYDGSEYGINVTVNEPKNAVIKYGTAKGNYTQDVSPTINNAGELTVYYQITAEGYETVTGSQTVKISPASIDTVKIEGAYTYNGQEQSPSADALTVTANNVPVPSSEYTVTYINNKNAGSAQAQVKVNEGSTNFTGEATGTFTIEPLSIANPSVSIEIPDEMYTGKPISANAHIKMDGKELVHLTDFDLEYQEGHGTELGPVNVDVTGYGNFTGTVTETFNIIPRKIHFEPKINNNNSGKIVHLDDIQNKEKNIFDVKDDLGNDLKEDVDYKITYLDKEKNPVDRAKIKTGEYTAKIDGIGNYEGSSVWVEILVSKYENKETKVVVKSDLTDLDIPETLKTDREDLDTWSEITEKITNTVVKQNNGYITKNTAVYDATLEVTTDGITWEPATQENFPKDGKLEVVLDYPEETASATHDFVVTHMFTTNDFRKTPGETENPKVTEKEDGLHFVVTGLSPIAVAWKETPRYTPITIPTVTPSPVPTVSPMPTVSPTPDPDHNSNPIHAMDTPVIKTVQVTGNDVKVILSGECEGMEGYDFVISKGRDCIHTKNYDKVNKNILLTETTFRYVQKGTYYAHCHAWKRVNGKKVFGDWSREYEFTVDATTPEKPVITSVKTNGSTVKVTYTKAQDAAGYDVVLGTALGKKHNEKRPVKYGKLVEKNIKGNVVTATFKNVPKGTYYAGLHAFNRTSKDGRKVFSPWSNTKKLTVK